MGKKKKQVTKIYNIYVNNDVPKADKPSPVKKSVVEKIKGVLGIGTIAAEIYDKVKH
jgi:hypothetical protein